jgi:SHS2 domain-containing protein
VQKRLYHEFRVETAIPPQLVARATGERYDPARHALLGSVKAATYHDLAVRSETGAAGPLWCVQVVLDT